MVADPANAATTCSGGALSAVSGSSLISHTGGSVAAGANCNVGVDVLGQAPGLHNNTTGPLTSSLGASGAASAALDVDELPDLALSLAAQPASVPEPGSTVTFTLSLTNTNVLETVTVTSLVDDVAGNLDGQGSCQTLQSLAPGASYSCHYLFAVNGNAGAVQTHTATADGALE